METVLIVIHLMVVLALVLVVLLQRSEGGALGIGGGGGGGMMTARGSANILTRATAALAVAFFATSIALAILARMDERPASILDAAPGTPTSGPAADGTSGSGNGILDQLRPQGGTQQDTQPAPSGPQVPAAE
ncbi:MAG: preprotein translocase subunit SecG [Stappia sp.]|uniref:preprotein translocase subunit SecG n=1 Tax=Stappia sp. TaxID=1870903 RepID=UPI000C4105F5|nr:preprotein translocase subunit SecG [Stappia sp.]MBM21796.1 preprotein translocase subunit SecG [Stappia sp.]